MPDQPSSSGARRTVADAGEAALIDRIRTRAGPPPSFVAVGIGDDAAIVEPARGRQDVVTTDSLVEDVHFRRAWTDARAIGAKAVTVNLSDLAAMGATPRVVLLSLALPPAWPLDDFEALVDGVVAAAGAAGAALVGGNLARSPGPLVIDVTAIGAVARRRALTRAGGRAGDELYVTGAVGGAAAGLAMLAAGLDRAAMDADAAACVGRYERPTARLRCGRLVAASRSARAAIDLSDGLADAIRQIAQASGTGALIDASLVPVDRGAARWFEAAGRDPVESAMAGGEDYELLFAVPPRRRRAFLAAARKCQGLDVTKIGSLTRKREIRLTGPRGPIDIKTSFRHFQA